MWLLKANPFSAKSGEVFNSVHFLLLTCILTELFWWTGADENLLFSILLLLSENNVETSHKKLQCLYLWLQAGLSATIVTLIKGFLLLSCLVYHLQLRLINRCYLDILLPFILFICILAELCLLSTSSMLADWLTSNLDKLLIFPTT